MEMYKISGWTEYELGASMMIAGFVLLTVVLLWERKRANAKLSELNFKYHYGNEQREFRHNEEVKALDSEIERLRGVIGKDSAQAFVDEETIHGLQGQIAHLTKQAAIYKKTKKSAAGKKGIETIKRRGKKK